MIFNTFDPNQDIVSGRITTIASGFWPNGLTNWSQSFFVDDFWDLTGSAATPSPSYGTSPYDVRRTMYYLNIFPAQSYHVNNDPYMSIAYGNVAGDLGSGSFTVETSSILASPTKAIYTEYKNLLLGTTDLSGMFTMDSGSTTISATDIWVMNMSAYKMKDGIDPGLLQFTLTGPNGSFTYIDDSPYIAQAQSVYQIITGSLTNPPANPTYQGLGLYYPDDGIIVINAALMASVLGITNTSGSGPGTSGPLPDGSWPYTPGTNNLVNYTYNHKTFAAALEASNTTMNVRKSEYVPSLHYFVRVMNRDFNYSNNPTFVYDGTDGIHSAGTIFNTDFVTNPTTYVTSIGLYDDSNELIAVAKLSRPAVKNFSNELLIKCRLDF
jgi:hypothetical protein